MKNLLIIVSSLLLCCSLNTIAQNNAGTMDDISRIALEAFVPSQIEGMPASAKANLENKLKQIAAKNGMAGGMNSRFIITANVTVLTKDITATAPPMQAYTLEVTLYIGDGIDGKAFSSTSVTLKGVGETETKAYMAALKNLKVADPKYQAFLEEGKNKIVQYYNTQCDFILKSAQTMASQDQYDEAITTLVTIPDVCKECYDKAMDAVQPIYQAKIDKDCKIKLQEAQSIWNAGQSYEAADQAGQILASIDPNATCYSEVTTLNNQIAKRVKEIDQREWNYILTEQKNDHEAKMSAINAAKEIGVAQAKQPINITYKTLW